MNSKNKILIDVCGVHYKPRLYTDLKSKKIKYLRSSKTKLCLLTGMLSEIRFFIGNRFCCRNSACIYARGRARTHIHCATYN